MTNQTCRSFVWTLKHYWSVYEKVCHALFSIYIEIGQYFLPSGPGSNSCTAIYDAILCYILAFEKKLQQCNILKIAANILNFDVI